MREMSHLITMRLVRREGISDMGWLRRPVRRAQLLSPFGVGSLNDFPGPESMTLCGLDAWPVDRDEFFFNGSARRREFEIRDEPRLAALLGVNHFILPPDYRGRGFGTNIEIKMPMLRWPLWHFCSICGKMDTSMPHHATPPKCNCRGWDVQMRQVRFVAACGAGHLHDFPWQEWVHWDKETRGVEVFEAHLLELKARGGASLSAIEIKCRSCGKSRTLSGAFDFTHAVGDSLPQSALSRIGIRCRGGRPWLAESSGRIECPHPLRAVLRGATNLYSADIKSAIWIPSVIPPDGESGKHWIYDVLSEATSLQEMGSKLVENGDSFNRNHLKSILKHHWQHLAGTARDEQDQAIAIIKLKAPEILASNTSFFTSITLIAQTNSVPIDERLLCEIEDAEPAVELLESSDGSVGKFLKLINRRFEQNVQITIKPDDNGDSTSEDDGCGAPELRREEYSVLSHEGEFGKPSTDLMIKAMNLADYDSDIQPYFERICLVHKLRETRAFAGFTRLDTGGLPIPTPLEKMNALISQSREPHEWRKSGWLPGYIVRGEGLFFILSTERLAEWLQPIKKAVDHRIRSFASAQTRMFRDITDKVTPEFLLLHTFSHLIMLELIFQCGYNSAALRERLYCGKDMAGVLIYTAAGDSEGSLGGLVRMGKPGNLELVIRRALDKAQWCSSDPVCMESRGQGPNNVNLAACHSCALVPETSCETGNRFLDRALVVGTHNNRSLGFFNGQGK